MARVVSEGDQPDGLAKMIACLVESNTQADPGRERLLESARGAVRSVTAELFAGRLRVRGLPSGLPIMARLTRLLRVVE